MALRAGARMAREGGDPARELSLAQGTLASLDAAMDDFVVRLNRAAMTQETALRLSKVLRRAAYYTSVVEQLPAIASVAQELPASVLASNDGLAADANRVRQSAADLMLNLATQEDEAPTDDIDRQANAWELDYQQLKAAVLEASALGTLASSAMEVLLRSNSALRRSLQQAIKASRVL